MFKAKSVEGIITAIAKMVNDLGVLAEAKDIEKDKLTVQVDGIMDRKDALVREIGRANRIADKLAKVIE